MYTIYDCCVTHKDTDVLKPFAWDFRRIFTENHDGIDLDGKECYSVCYGAVISVGQDANDKYEVTVQYDEDVCVRYCNLSILEPYIVTGYAIKYDEKIGMSNDYIHFEYCVRVPSHSTSIVRIAGETWYKADPDPLLADRYAFVGDYRENPTQEES